MPWRGHFCPRLISSLFAGDRRASHEWGRGSLRGCAPILLLRQFSGIFGAILELRLRVQENQVDGADGSVTLLGDDQLGQSLEVFAIAIVYFFAIAKTSRDWPS